MTRLDVSRQMMNLMQKKLRPRRSLLRHQQKAHRQRRPSQAWAQQRGAGLGEPVGHAALVAMCAAVAPAPPSGCAMWREPRDHQ